MTDRWLPIKFLAISATVYLLFALASVAQAQQNDKGTEVFLSFQYEGVVSSYVTAYYKNGQFYLPVSELFSLLKINHNVDQGRLAISGVYLGDTNYQLDFNNQFVRAADTEINLHAEDFLIKEVDYFLKPAIFDALFGLQFSTNFNNLTLHLETSDKMPVIAQYERKQERKRLDRDEPLYKRTFYPLHYDRNYNTLQGAFLDYNLSGVYTTNSQLFTFNNSLGAEVFAGDVQGNIFGALSDQQQTFTTQGLRWRYVQRNNNYFSSVIAGQTNSEGISSRAISGLKISNKPIEPRRLFDRYPIEGDAPAQSEVELYLNNRLVDFQNVDESDNYRFLVPLTYGSTNYSVRIYTPSGTMIQRNNRIQVPFDYLPPGEIDYSISGGELDNPILGSSKRGYLGEATLSAGLSKWLTVRGSTEYLTEYHSNTPSFTGTLNARMFSKYLISASANSENFYRLNSSVVYSSGASWNLSYDYNPGNSRLYNTGGSDHLGTVALFTPFQVGIVPLNLRWSSTYQTRNSSEIIRYRADLSSRLGRLNVRLAYQDRQTGNINLTTTSSSRLTNSYTYSVPRFKSVPNLLRGMFLRGQLTYLPGLQEIEEMEFQLSRNIFDSGRIQLTYGRNLLAGFNTLSLNFTVDFNKVRSNTTTRITGSEVTINQSLRGSIGYDSYSDQLLLNNRQQVGQAAAAVRLFVDNNNNSTYQKDIDDIITDPAVRMNRAGGRTQVKNDINYISQLLPYYRYNLEINQSSLSNPLLIPDMENFSIVTDPNQYKTIEIPFYRSGVISGRVEKKVNGKPEGLSGVRLYLQSDYNGKTGHTPFTKELRTFSDGSFYTHEVPPGKYQLFIDPNQLAFLQAFSNPDTMELEVKALAEGDFVENLNFTVLTKEDTTAVEPEISSADTLKAVDEKMTMDDSDLFYKIQLASFKTVDKAKRIAKEAAKDLGNSFSVVYNSNTSLYGIRSVPIASRKQAVETVLSYHDNQYKRAVLIVLSSRVPQTTVQKKNKFIQIGAFSTQKRAENFANESARKLNFETVVTYNKKATLYKVYINKRFHSQKVRTEILTKIRNEYSFEKAFINDNDKIQIGAFKNKNSAQFFASQSQEILQKRTTVAYDSTDKLYNVSINERFDSVTAQKKALNVIKNYTSPYHDAFVSFFDGSDKLNQNDISRRTMAFDFEIEIKGITQETEKAYIESATNNRDNIRWEKPHKNRLVFKNIRSWADAQTLYQKLSKIPSPAHSILILIEESM